MQFAISLSAPSNSPAAQSAGGAASAASDSASSGPEDASFADLLPTAVKQSSDNRGGSGKPSTGKPAPKDDSSDSSARSSGSADATATSLQQEVVAASTVLPALPTPVATPAVAVTAKPVAAMSNLPADAAARSRNSLAALAAKASSSSDPGAVGADAKAYAAFAAKAAATTDQPAPAAMATALSGKAGAKPTVTSLLDADDTAPVSTPQAVLSTAAAPTASVLPTMAAATGAKIAVPTAKDSSSDSSVRTSGVKKVETADSKSITDAQPLLGTAVAKVTSVMPNATATDRVPTPTAILAVAPSATVSSGGTSAAADGGTAPTASTTGAAVQAALTTAEMLSASNSAKAVNLQFSVGNADLSLRVQLLNGQVHATFSTDSAQLRSALANEWQSMTSTSGTNVHLAEPVFTASGGGSFLSGDETGRQNSRQAAEDFAAALPSSSFSTVRSTHAAEPVATASSAPVTVASSQHLQTFA